MTKNQAIQIVTKHTNKQNKTQPVSIDSREILDDNPTELKEFWCFKNYYEDLNSMRPDEIKLNSQYPFIFVAKNTWELILADWNKYYELKKE